MTARSVSTLSNTVDVVVVAPRPRTASTVKLKRKCAVTPSCTERQYLSRTNTSLSLFSSSFDPAMFDPARGGGRLSASAILVAFASAARVSASRPLLRRGASEEAPAFSSANPSPPLISPIPTDAFNASIHPAAPPGSESSAASASRTLPSAATTSNSPSAAPFRTVMMERSSSDKASVTRTEAPYTTTACVSLASHCSSRKTRPPVVTTARRLDQPPPPRTACSRALTPARPLRRSTTPDLRMRPSRDAGRFSSSASSSAGFHLPRESRRIAWPSARASFSARRRYSTWTLALPSSSSSSSSSSRFRARPEEDATATTTVLRHSRTSSSSSHLAYSSAKSHRSSSSSFARASKLTTSPTFTTRTVSPRASVSTRRSPPASTRSRRVAGSSVAHPNVSTTSGGSTPGGCPPASIVDAQRATHVVPHTMSGSFKFKHSCGGVGGVSVWRRGAGVTETMTCILLQISK